MSASFTARDVKDALRRRYCGADLTGQQWVCIDEARSGAGFAGNNGSCDFLAINTWHGRGMQLIGHEVKVSLADWKKELAEPEKAERFARYCRRWFVVVPSTLATKIKDEVPPAWGLMSLGPKGGLTEIRKAPAREPEPVPEWWWVGWLAQIDRGAKRDAARVVQEGMAVERERLRERVEADVARQREYQDQQNEALRENARRLKEATGIDLAYAWSGTFTRLGELYAIARDHGDFQSTINLLRKAAESLEAIAAVREEERAS